jgi:hypothetical protein
MTVTLIVSGIIAPAIALGFASIAPHRKIK